MGIYLLLFFGLSRLLTPKWNYPKWQENTSLKIQEAMNLDRNRVDAVFLGTSHCEFAVSPVQIYQENGIVSINGSTSGQPVDVSRFLLQKIFKRQSPKVLILDASSLFFREETDHGTYYRYIIDTVPFSISYENYSLYRSYIKNKYRSAKIRPKKKDILRDLIGCVFPLYFYHSRWNELEESDFTFFVKDYFLQGYIMSSSTVPAESDIGRMNEEAERLSKDEKGFAAVYHKDRKETKEENGEHYSTSICEAHKQTLLDIKKLCDEKHCRLLITKIPAVCSPRIYPGAWSRARYEEVKRVAREMGIDYVDLLYDDKVRLDWSVDTKDGGQHVNYLGAQKISSFFRDYLRDQYHIPPGKDKDYDQKSVIYDKAVKAAKLEMETDFSEYMNTLSKEKRHLAVIISAKEDMRVALRDKDIRSLRLLGLKTDFARMKEGDSFAALIDQGFVVHESTSNQKIRQEGRLKDSTDILMESAGYYSGNTGIINLNNKPYSAGGRGINIVVYDYESGQVIDSACFDIHDPGHTATHFQGDSYLQKYTWFLIKNQ